ncbi:hypothetical protein N5T62_05070 [Aliarcobacter cryaerophilus]|uniref:hypothetical protein n=1 Tax=Aliarcobacter cryaerophilus TaxID=28198 RepID=UPI0021B2FE1A|nr:hypothetical protein [Aliarcobacter cryaerophilus]MCT7505448.1 hypothetical protein [Aliarcobacter cryaerophilus]
MKKENIKMEAEKLIKRSLTKNEIEALYSFLILKSKDEKENMKSEIEKLNQKMEEEIKKVISKFNSKIEEKEKNFLEKMIKNSLTILKIGKEEMKTDEEKNEQVQDDENKEKGFRFWNN